MECALGGFMVCVCVYLCVCVCSCVSPLCVYEWRELNVECAAGGLVVFMYICVSAL